MGFLEALSVLGLQSLPSEGRDSSPAPTWDTMASDTGGGQCEDLARQEGRYRLASTLATPPLCHHTFGSVNHEAVQELGMGKETGVTGWAAPPVS